jgi:hypothetical protein
LSEHAWLGSTLLTLLVIRNHATIVQVDKSMQSEYGLGLFDKVVKVPAGSASKNVKIISDSDDVCTWTRGKLRACNVYLTARHPGHTQASTCTVCRIIVAI